MTLSLSLSLWCTGPVEGFDYRTPEGEYAPSPAPKLAPPIAFCRDIDKLQPGGCFKYMQCKHVWQDVPWDVQMFTEILTVHWNFKCLLKFQMFTEISNVHCNFKCSLKFQMFPDYTRESETSEVCVRWGQSRWLLRCIQTQLKLNAMIAFADVIEHIWNGMQLLLLRFNRIQLKLNTSVAVSM